MTDLAFIYRMDKKNVGDWVCSPSLYFPFKPALKGDILDKNLNLQGIDTLILGGGGLGTKYFEPHLNRIKEGDVENVIVWGAGIDLESDRSMILKDQKYDLYGDYFNEFSDVGIRVYSPQQKFTYVPCASCMDNLFFKYRDVKPTKKIGYYNHKRVPLASKNFFNRAYVNDNNGNSLEDKLKFLSSFEYIVTNSYHGVYWATLLQRKVIVVPFKSGLLSFKQQPTISWDGHINDQMLDSAVSYEGVLEESRRLNLSFFKEMTDKYSLV